jgi:hypothetical protein
MSPWTVYKTNRRKRYDHREVANPLRVAMGCSKLLENYSLVERLPWLLPRTARLIPKAHYLRSVWWPLGRFTILCDCGRNLPLAIFRALCSHTRAVDESPALGQIRVSQETNQLPGLRYTGPQTARIRATWAHLISLRIWVTKISSREALSIRNAGRRRA